MDRNFAFLIVTGAPDNMEFGIDLLAINITEHFRGVKFIPAGVHFIYSSSRDHFGNPSTNRSGFLHYFKAGEILVKEFNQKEEELQNRSKGNTEIEIERIRENLMDLDRFLAVYDYKNIGKWKNLTSLLSYESIKRLSPDCEIIRNSVEYKSFSDKDRPKGKATVAIRNVRIKNLDDEAKYLPQMEVVNETMPKFSKIPERYNQFSTPEEKTLNNIDTINLIDKLFTEISSKANILEEIQFSFIVFMCALSIESLSHWRQILSLLCNSERAVAKHKAFYKQFVNVIRYQLPEIPVEFIEQSSTNTIYIDTKNLLRNLMNNDCKDIADVLIKYLDETISWTFEDIFEEDPEDLPQIVEIDS